MTYSMNLKTLVVVLHSQAKILAVFTILLDAFQFLFINFIKTVYELTWILTRQHCLDRAVDVWFK